jgi:hypothetical protein
MSKAAMNAWLTGREAAKYVRMTAEELWSATEEGLVPVYAPYETLLYSRRELDAMVRMFCVEFDGAGEEEVEEHTEKVEEDEAARERRIMEAALREAETKATEKSAAKDPRRDELKARLEAALREARTKTQRPATARPELTLYSTDALPGLDAADQKLFWDLVRRLASDDPDKRALNVTELRVLRRMATDALEAAHGPLSDGRNTYVMYTAEHRPEERRRSRRRRRPGPRLYAVKILQLDPEEAAAMGVADSVQE